MLWTPGEAFDVVAVPIPATTSGRSLFGPNCWVSHIALAEASGAASVTAWLVNGDSDTGIQLVPVVLAANGVLVTTLGNPGIPFDAGLFLSVTGEIEGSVGVAVLK